MTEELEKELFDEKTLEKMDKARRRIEKKLRPHREALRRCSHITAEDLMITITPCEPPSREEYYAGIRGVFRRVRNYFSKPQPY